MRLRQYGRRTFHEFRIGGGIAHLRNACITLAAHGVKLCVNVLDLGADVAREILVRLHVRFRAVVKVEVCKFQFVCYLAHRLSAQLAHIREIDIALLLHGDDERILGRIGMLRANFRQDGALREDVRLGHEVPLRILDLIGADKVIAGIGVEHIRKRAVSGDMPIAFNVSVIELAERLLCAAQLLCTSASLLHLEHSVPGITQEDSGDHASPRLLIERRRSLLAVGINVDQRTAREIKAHGAHIRLLCLHGHRQFRLCRCVDTPGGNLVKDCCDPLTDLRPLLCCDRQLRAVASLALLPSAEYVLGMMIAIVSVDDVRLGKIPSVHVYFLLNIHPCMRRCRLEDILLLGCLSIALLAEDKDIRGDRRSRPGEGFGRKAHRGDEVSALSQHITRAARQLIHRTARRDRGDQSAVTHLVQHLHDKIVMRQQSCAAVARIGSNRRLAEGNIADGKIKTPVRESCCLKALRCDTYIGMRSGGDARRERIQLHAADVTFPPHLLRHRREEPPCPAGWFEDIPLGKTEVLQSLIDCLGDIGRRIVGVQDTAARCTVLLVRQM